jgi:hypothetical protein
MFDPTVLFLSLVAGGAGFVLLVYGKKQGRMPHLLAGLAFMVYPYFVDGVFATIFVGLAIAVGLWLALRAGW